MKAPHPKFDTWGDYLNYSYANLNALCYAEAEGIRERNRVFYLIRAKAYKAYREGRWNIHSLYAENREKMLNAGYCYYCECEIPTKDRTADHIIPRIKGGDDTMDNLLIACKHCNSSKGSLDLFEWYFTKLGYWPNIWLIVHYMKQIYMYSKENGLLEKSREQLFSEELPFKIQYIPYAWPPPKNWIDNNLDEEYPYTNYIDLEW